MDANAVSFGRAKGQAAQLFTLDNGSLKACITDYAGALVSLEAPDRNGKAGHVVLGFDDVAGYADNRGSFGALLGRTSNRIAGGRFTIDGKTYKLSKNEGENTLHGGARGLTNDFGRAKEASPQHVKLSLTSARWRSRFSWRGFGRGDLAARRLEFVAGVHRRDHQADRRYR